jgi:hypothetical protein
VWKKSRLLVKTTWYKRESPIPAPRTPSAFHRRAQRTAFRYRDARQQSSSFARWNQSLRRSPNSKPAFAEIISDDFQVRPCCEASLF